MRKIGVLTGGGDCPGLNAVIRAVVERCAQEGIEVFGFYDGWRGVLKCDGKWLTMDDVDGIQTLGGTILGSSRTNLIKVADGIEKTKETMEKLGLDSLVAIGGDDTLGVAYELGKRGFNVVGVPKTIDNDLNNTDYTFGFDSASNIAMRAIDDLKHTALSHRRCIVVELMGRYTGWITIQAGIAANAHVIAIPEFPISVDEICKVVQERNASGKQYSLIAVAEAANISGLDQDDSNLKKDAFGNVAMQDRGIAERLAKVIGDKTGVETRHVVLGHLQRGGNPSCFDRVLATRMGYCAAEQIINKNYGVMASLCGNQILPLPIKDALETRKEVDEELYNMAKVFFH